MTVALQPAPSPRAEYVGDTAVTVSRGRGTAHVVAGVPRDVLRIALLLALASPVGARAQDAPPEGVEQVLVRREGGDELRGQLLRLGPETLTLLVEGQRIDLPISSVVRMDSGGDPVRNGALIGALIGGGFCALVCGQGVGSAAEVPMAVLVSAVFWGGVGAGIDAMIPGRTTIYRRPPPSRPRAMIAYRVTF